MGEFKHTEKFLKTYGDQVEQEIETRLHNLGKVASGELIESIGYEVKETPARFTLSFHMAEYGYWVDKGSKPSKYANMKGKGKGKSKFITKLMKWCDIKGLPKNAAFPIRRNIWKFGQKPTNFFTIPTTRRAKQLNEGITRNMALDAKQILLKNVRNTRK